MNRIFNILIVGVGGQGIILASDILTLAAQYAGYDTKKSEIHGMSQRGGSVFSHIRFGEKVYSPVIPEGEVDILISLEEMETLRWLYYINENTKVFLLEEKIKPSNVKEYPTGIKEELMNHIKDVHYIDLNKINKLIKSLKFLNVALLGVISNFLDFQEKAWVSAIKENVPEKTFDDNWQAFLIGKKYSLEGR